MDSLSRTRKTPLKLNCSYYKPTTTPVKSISHQKHQKHLLYVINFFLFLIYIDLFLFDFKTIP